jgi:CRP-like cAMP-binding protein
MSDKNSGFPGALSHLSCPLFTGIAEADLEALLSCLGARHQAFERGEYLYHAGDPAHNVGVVLGGAVLVIQEDYGGGRSIVAHVSPGELFAEALASAEVAEMPVSVCAAENCEVLLINYARIVTSCSSACGFHSRLVRNMMGILARNNVRLTRKIAHVTQRSTREKVLSYLSDQAMAAGCLPGLPGGGGQGTANFEIPFNRQELADYLAVDRSALSSELSHMQEAGIIRYHRNNFELL